MNIKNDSVNDPTLSKLDQVEKTRQKQIRENYYFFRMNNYDLRKCEVLDMFMPRSYMIKIDFEKKDILDRDAVWKICQKK